MAFRERYVSADIYSTIDKQSPVINRGLHYYFEECEANGITRNDWKGEASEQEFAKNYINPLSDSDMCNICDAIRYAHQEELRRVPKYDLDFVQDVEFNIANDVYDNDKRLKRRHKWRLFMILIECVESSRG